MGGAIVRGPGSALVPRSVVAALFVASLGLGATACKKPEGGAGPAGSASARPAAGGGPIVADGLRVAGRPLSVTVPVNGTLVANEAVAIAAELSRRVVQVKAEDGARVKKGDLLFQLDAADLHAEARQLDVRRRLLRDQLTRQTKLRTDGLSSEADLERARADLDLVEAQLASLSVTLARTSIRAPFDGRLGLRNVSVGAMVSPQTTLVTLEDASRIKIDLTLPERYASFVHEGARFSFRSAQGKAPHEGKVVAIEPRIDATTRSLRVRGVAENPDGALRPGAFVTVDFPIEARDGAVMLPSTVVVPSVGGHQVWREIEGKAALVPVEIGVRTETEVEVLRGIAPGDVVLTSNLLRLREGGPVKLGKVEGGEAPAAAPAPSASAGPVPAGVEGAPAQPLEGRR